ncbi:unnamed protein product, partial [marine sediment metagenome]
RQLITYGVQVPYGFATTSFLYREFISHNQLAVPIQCKLDKLSKGELSLREAGKAIRGLIERAHFSVEQKQVIIQNYQKLCSKNECHNMAVAVRSSATAEDLPEASFAGQQESFLNIRSPEALIEACRLCFASLYTDRAIIYRQEQGFSNIPIALSIFGDHSDVMSARGTGFAILCANSVQEAMDFAFIAQAASLKGRVPVLHFFDGFRTSHEVNKVSMPAHQALAAMLDDDAISEHRMRAMSPVHPVVRGTSQNPDVFFQSREATNPYYHNFPKVVQSLMNTYG